MKTGILISLVLFLGISQAIDISPPEISGIFADPNPFSPNGDGRADSTIIHFSLSEPSYLSVWENGTGTPIISDVFYPSGANSFLWDGSGFEDGTWNLLFTARDTSGNQSDTVALQVIIDTHPPHIDTFSFEPNPFSPDSNGIQDYCKITLIGSGTNPEEYDTFFIPNRIGRITIWNDSVETEWTFSADHTPPLPPFPVYFSLYPVSMSGGIGELNLHFLDWGGNVVDITVENSFLLQRIGDLTNRMTSVSFWPDSIPEGESATIDIYAFTGNAAIEIYDSTGALVSQTNFWEVFEGDGEYFTLWGPGPIPDGLYNVKIYLEDESYNTHMVTGEVIANSVPTTLSGVFVEPSVISPANEDNNFDITQIHYTLSEGAYVTVKISRSQSDFSPSQIVNTLLDSIIETGGPHAVPYNGTDELGDFLSVDSESTYYVVIQAIDPLSGDEDMDVVSLTIDNKAPEPPELIPLLTPTSNPQDTLRGTSEPGTVVMIYNNAAQVGETLADSVTGNFSFLISYEEGENNIYGVALDEVLNQSQPSETISVVFDANPPFISGSYPEDGAWISTDTISSVWVALNDASSGIDLDASYASLRREGETYTASLSRILPDTLLLTLETPITPGAGLDGQYSIALFTKDLAGNSSTDTVRFGYDSEPPEATILPGDSALVDSFDEVKVTLVDNLSGPDFSNTEIGVSGPNGPLTGDTVLEDGVLKFILDPPLSRDGSHDGRYFIEVIARDSAGSQRTYEQTLIYDTRPPGLKSSYPESGDVVITPIEEIWVTVTDSIVPQREPSGFDPWASQISLLDPDGNSVPGEKRISGDTLGLTLSAPLSLLGNYTVVLYLRDNATNGDSVSYSFFFDTQNPSVQSTKPADSSALKDTLTEIEVIFQDPGGSGMDPDYSTLMLLDPYSVQRKGSLNWKGTDTLVFALSVPLNPNGSEDGEYKVLIWGQDQAGHPLVPTNPDTVVFVFDNHEPYALYTWPDSGEVDVFIGDSVGVDASDLVPGVSKVAGIDFDLSTITLIDPEGHGVPGHKEYLDRGDGTGLLYWMIAEDAVLPDGEYQMEVHLADRAGNYRDIYVTFQTLEKAPTVISTSPDSGEIVNSLREAEALVLDRTGTGIDTSASIIRVLDPEDVPLSGSTSFEGTDTLITFVFTPEPPPTLNGTYTLYVLPVANNGQTGKEKSVPFTLDTNPPELLSSYPEPLDTIWSTPPQVWLLFLETETYLDTATIFLSVFSPSRIELPGETSLRGDTLFFTPEGNWTEEGLYTVRYSVKDGAGNPLSDSVKFSLLNAFAWETNPHDGDTVMSPLQEVKMIIKRRKGTKTTEWYLYLTNSDGDTVPGTSSAQDESTYVYTLDEALKADGSALGPYTILGGVINDEQDTLTFGATFVYWVDTLPPGPPTVTTPPPERTMEDTVSLSGLAEPSSRVILWVNGTPQDSTDALADSSFSFHGVSISEGENTLVLRAHDLFDNLSDSTTLVVIQGAPPFSIRADKPVTLTNNNFYVSLPEAANVTVRVFNLRGDFVWRTTVSMDPGIERPIPWPRLENHDGHQVNNGPYLLIITAKYSNGQSETKKDLFTVLR